MVKSLRSIWVLAFLLAVAVFSAGGVWGGVAWRSALGTLADRGGRTDLTLASDRLTRHLFRYRELAVLLSDHPDLKALLDGGDRAWDARELLRSMSDRTGGALGGIELVDRDGLVLASSRPGHVRRDPHSAPLRRALNGALGVTNGGAETAPSGLTRRLFTFAAPPVFADTGPARGAVLVEVDIWLFEQNWPTTATATFFINDAGQVFVTNRSELTLTDRFGGDEGFPAHSIRHWFGHEVWQLDGGPYLPAQALHLAADIHVIDMMGETLLDTAPPAVRTATLQAAVAAALCLAFGAVLLVLAERRRALSDRLAVEAAANARLEARVAERTAALSQANEELTRTQAELVQAGKLSALGQMSAGGISHELNQPPLMAIRSFAENGTAFLDRDRPEKAAQNLGRISELANRMGGRIIKNLRAFARNESEPLGGRVDLVQVIQSAVELTEARLRVDGVALSWSPPPACYVRAGEVRLVQVMVNLINNAADAWRGGRKKNVSKSMYCPVIPPYR